MTPRFDSVAESRFNTLLESRMGVREYPVGLVIVIAAAATTISREIWEFSDPAGVGKWNFLEYETIHMQYGSSDLFREDLEFLEQIVTGSGLDWRIEIWQPLATKIAWSHRVSFAVKDGRTPVAFASNVLSSLGPPGWTNDLPSYIQYQSHILRTIPFVLPSAREAVDHWVDGFIDGPLGSRTALNVEGLLEHYMSEAPQLVRWIRQDSLLAKWDTARDRLDRRPDKVYVVIQRLWDWPFTGPLTKDTYDRSPTGSNTSPLTQMKAAVARDEIEYIPQTLRSDGRWLRQAAEIIQVA